MYGDTIIINHLSNHINHILILTFNMKFSNNFPINHQIYTSND